MKIKIEIEINQCKNNCRYQSKNYSKSKSKIMNIKIINKGDEFQNKINTSANFSSEV